MNLPATGILPRLGLALLPWLTGELVGSRFSGCFASESPFCIYLWHPPAMDVMFALLVLAPFMTARTMVALRVLALVVLSVLVHVLAVGFLVETRGTLDVPGVDSIFVNIFPIAIIASLVTVSLAALACGLALNLRLFLYAVLAGLPVAALFVVTDIALATPWMPVLDNVYWAVWHLSVCCAMYYGRALTDRGPRHPATPLAA